MVIRVGNRGFREQMERYEREQTSRVGREEEEAKSAREKQYRRQVSGGDRTKIKNGKT